MDKLDLCYLVMMLRLAMIVARIPTMQGIQGKEGESVEENIERNRLRAPSVDTLPFDLHVSDCLDDLKPDDHFEIQWRKRKEFPYDTVLLEFKQYSPGSRWRQTVINRKDHREEGNEADGFYGGIRKLYSDKEVSLWKFRLGGEEVAPGTHTSGSVNMGEHRNRYEKFVKILENDHGVDEFEAYYEVVGGEKKRSIWSCI